MVGGGVVQVEEDFEAAAHVARAHNNSECRTPIIMVLEDGDPYASICKLAKDRGCAVWNIEMGNERNEQNAIDYVEVGIQNGDWVYLTNNEAASEETLRQLARTLVMLAPEPKKFPRRELFRLWLAVQKPINLNDTINPIFPQLMAQNAIVCRAGAPPGMSNHSPMKWVKRLPQEPVLFEKEVVKHQHRRDAGRDSDSESDTEDPTEKITGLWFHRAVDFHTADEVSKVRKASEEVYVAIEADDASKVEELCKTGQIDLDRLKKNGMSPLQYACSLEKVESAQVLLAAGAQPNQPRDSDQCPPLFMSIESVDLVQALIDYGADFYAKFEGYRLESHPSTAPHIAAMIKDLKGASEKVTPGDMQGTPSDPSTSPQRAETTETLQES